MGRLDVVADAVRAEVGIALVVGQDDDEIWTGGGLKINRNTNGQGQCQQMLSHGEGSARSQRRSRIPGKILFPLRAVHVVGIEALDVAIDEQSKRLAAVAGVGAAIGFAPLRNPIGDDLPGA